MVYHKAASGLSDHTSICRIASSKDVLAIENTSQFQGKYHVLGGIISPIQGVGPNDLNIESLIERIKNDSEIKEIICL